MSQDSAIYVSVSGGYLNYSLVEDKTRNYEEKSNLSYGTGVIFNIKSNYRLKVYFTYVNKFYDAEPKVAPNPNTGGIVNTEYRFGSLNVPIVGDGYLRFSNFGIGISVGIELSMVLTQSALSYNTVGTTFERTRDGKCEFNQFRTFYYGGTSLFWEKGNFLLGADLALNFPMWGEAGTCEDEIRHISTIKLNFGYRLK